MRYTSRYHMAKAGILLVSVFAFLISIGSCSRGKKSPQQEKYVYGDWQIAANTPDYESADSLLFLINPATVRPPYNGMYSSQYVENDSLRATIVYDTIAGYRLKFQRMIAVTVNPPMLNLALRSDSDSTIKVLNCTQLTRQENVYAIPDRKIMDSLMLTGKRIYFKAVSPGGNANPDVQTYSFVIHTRGFAEARMKCNEFNRHRPAVLKASHAPAIDEELFGL